MIRKSLLTIKTYIINRLHCIDINAEKPDTYSTGKGGKRDGGETPDTQPQPGPTPYSHRVQFYPEIYEGSSIFPFRLQGYIFRNGF